MRETQRPGAGDTGPKLRDDGLKTRLLSRIANASQPAEAVAHALFEVTVRREVVPHERQAVAALINKYMAYGRVGQ